MEPKYLMSEAEKMIKKELQGRALRRRAIGSMALSHDFFGLTNATQVFIV